MSKTSRHEGKSGPLQRRAPSRRGEFQQLNDVIDRIIGATKPIGEAKLPRAGIVDARGKVRHD